GSHPHWKFTHSSSLKRARYPQALNIICKNNYMLAILTRTAASALALWLVIVILGPAIAVQPFNDDTLGWILSYLVVALHFGILNATLGKVIRVLAIPLYILTLGVIGFFINAFILWLVAQLSPGIGWGLYLQDYFWTGVFAAALLTLFNWSIGIFFKPARK